MNTSNGWSQYEKLVLNRLDALDARLGRLEEGQVLLRIDVARLKVKAGVWGGLAGFVPAALVVALTLLSGGS